MKYNYQNELDKTCFQHDMAYGDLKELKRITFPDKVLCDKAFNIAKDPKYDGFQMVFKCFDKKISGSSIKIINISNKELAK